MLNVLLAAALLSGIDVELRMLDGRKHTGELISLSTDEVLIRTPAGEVAVPSRELHALTPAPTTDPSAAELPEGAIRVRLVDASELQASKFEVAAGRATMQLSGGEETRASTAAVRSVRFRQQSPQLREQWAAIERAERSGDVLVIRKTQRVVDDKGQEQVTEGLDSLEGVLSDVTGETVDFNFDGTSTEVPREKVEGLIYFQRTASTPAEPRCQVVDRWGSAWNVKSLKLDGRVLECVSAAGVRTRLPLERLDKIDFSIGNLVFLSDLEMEQEWRPLIQSPTTPPSLKELFRPRRDQGFFGGPLTLDGQACDKGLAIHSRTVLNYRLTRDFQRLVATAGIDHRFPARGSVTLTVTGNGRELFSATIAGDQPPVPVDVDVRGVRRLTLLVDFGPDRSDVGDYLNLCNARLLK